MIAFIGPFVAFVGTCLLIMLLRPFAIASGLVDRPNARSSHEKPTPLVGGLSIYVAVAVAYTIPATMGLLPLNREYGVFFIAGLLLVSVGVVDDRRPLSSLTRFGAQILATLLMVLGANVVLSDLGGMTFSGESLKLGMLSIPFTVFATLGVINALNMSDGLDGLSGSMALISLTGLFIAALYGGHSTDAYLLLLLAVGVAGFLMFNLRFPWRKSAAVFMGDAGSTFLGFALTWFAISLSQGSDRVITPAAALWFLMLPLFDTVSMIIRRIRAGKSPFEADKEHIHHVFLMAGFSVNETIIIMAAAAMIGVGIGLLSLDIRAPELTVAALFLVAGLLYMWMVLRSWKIMQFIQRSMCRRRVEDRRSGIDRRQVSQPDYPGPERRALAERRTAERRSGDTISDLAKDEPGLRLRQQVDRG